MTEVIRFIRTVKEPNLKKHVSASLPQGTKEEVPFQKAVFEQQKWQLTA